jgi:hypothetical protein
VVVKVRRLPGIFAILAVLLNLGSPMALAQLAAPEPAPAAECHGHGAESEQASDSNSDSMPCCEDGGCQCAAPALSLPAAMTPATPLHPVFIAPGDTSTSPAHPLDDNLRPPIR